MAFAPILLFCKFRFAHPRGRRPSRCPARFPFSAFQSTHLLGGLPSDVRTWPWLQPFRFMSPVWERGQTSASEAPAGRISVHSLCVRGDMLQNCGTAPAFQSVLPRGDDSRADSTKRRKAGFHPRIHAGAAQGGFRVRQSSRHFNPRPRAGCDGAASSLTSPRQSFKPTRPNGVRPLPTKPPSLYQFIAIHAPALGAV